MANIIRVSANSINRDAERIKELNGTLPALVKELEEAMEKLSGCWEGIAWASFQETTAYYMETLTDVYKYMGEFVEKMLEASQDYERTEQDICGGIKWI